MGRSAFIFPGQSSQYVGMGKELYEKIPVVREVFDHACEVTGKDIRSICFEGPPEVLNETMNTQPCILTMSYAAFLALKAYGLAPDAIAGFSMGEFSAMVAAGIVSFDDALALLKVRAKAMQEAVPLGEGAMVAVKSDRAQRAVEICGQITEGYAALSNISSPTTLLFAGEKKAMNILQERLTAEGIKNRIVAVSVPAHCRLMDPAREPLEKALAKTAMHAPQTDFYMCADAQKESDVDKIREKEVMQLYMAAQCEGIIRNMIKDGVDTFVEVGPKNIYARYAKEIDPSVRILNVEDMATLEATVKALQEDRA